MNRYLVGMVGATVWASVASGCADEHHLTARGNVVVEDARVGFRSAFDFVNATRLDEPSAPVTGSCRVRRVRADDLEAEVILRQSADVGVRELTVSTASGQLAISAATTTGSTYAGTCSAFTTEIDDGGSVVIETASGCNLVASSGDIAALELFIELHGCAVE